MKNNSNILTLAKEFNLPLSCLYLYQELLNRYPRNEWFRFSNNEGQQITTDYPTAVSRSIKRLVKTKLIDVRYTYTQGGMIREVIVYGN